MSKKISHLLLFIMFIFYVIPIYLVYSLYNQNKHNNSISSIISHHPVVFVFMVMMGLFTILYEINRGDYKSMCYILMLLIGIYGVLLIKETYAIHYVFAFLVFASILSFMSHHCSKTKCEHLRSFFRIEWICFVLLLICLSTNSPYFFHLEAFLIVNFGLYYIYLHIMH
jgi:hypothetical protein